MCAKVFYVFCHRDARSFRFFFLFHIGIGNIVVEFPIERELHFNWVLGRRKKKCFGNVWKSVIYSNH